MAMQAIEQLAAQYADFTMDAKHRVLGEALYYLEVVESTHSIPGIEGVEVIPNMNMWCYPPPPYSNATKSVQACLAAIWYMTRTQELLVMRAVPDTLRVVMGYLNDVASEDDMAGLLLPDGSIRPCYGGVVPLPVDVVVGLLHTLMETLPLMREGYDTAKGAAPHGG